MGEAAPSPLERAGVRPKKKPPVNGRLSCIAKLKLLLEFSVFVFEFVDTAGSVNKFRLTSVERV